VASGPRSNGIHVWQKVTLLQTWVVIFSSAEVSCCHRISGVQWHSVITVTLGLGCTPPYTRRPGPLSGAAKHPAGARPSKCIILISTKPLFSSHGPIYDSSNLSERIARPVPQPVSYPIHEPGNCAISPGTRSRKHVRGNSEDNK
jgi:hypothetical protein